MPGAEDKTQVAAAETPVAEAKPKKSFKKLFLFGGIGLGVVVIGVLLAVFVLRPMMSGTGHTTANKPKAEQTEKKQESEKKEQPKENKHEAAQGEASGGLVYTIKDIVINPAGTSGSRFLSVSFGFDLASAEVESQFDQREPLIRDALITIMSSKTVAQLTDAREKEITRLQIKKRLSDLLKTGDISAVYFTDFVLQ